MIKRFYFFFLILLAASGNLIAQRMSPQEYIAQYKDIAIREMKRSGVPAAITLAQGILESEAGNSDLVKRSNNHFGIKCKSTWTGESVTHDDDEKGECFRAYKDAEQSFVDHSDFLKNGARYSSLFSLDPTDYKAWARGLKKAGYATNPRYADILIRNIELYNLGQYDLSDYEMIAETNEEAVKPSAPVTPEEVINMPAPTVSESTGEMAKLTINGIRAILADKGTSLLAIATQNNIKLSRLLEYNELKKDGLLAKKSIIFLERKSKEGKNDVAVVEPGESLYDVSQKNAILLASLCEYNGLKENSEVKPGMQLRLKPHEVAMITDRGKDGATAKEESNRSKNSRASAPLTHSVQAREGLYAISKKYGVPVSRIKELNNLRSEKLQTGQVLIISK